MANPIVFPYKNAAGKPSPIISAGVEISGCWRVAEFYVDSGAFYSLMPAPFARDFGLEYQKGQKLLVQVGDGALIPVFLHDLPIQIGHVTFKAPIGFSAKLGVPFNLLGRAGVFEHFKICFHEKRKLTSFQPLD